MAITENSSGTQTATISTEHTLATITADGVYVLAVDLNNLVNGDRVVLRAKAKVTSGGTTRQFFAAVYEHAQADKVVQSIPVPSVHEVVFTLQQTAGTGRAFDWSVLSL